jgi:hypothetical protein
MIDWVAALDSYFGPGEWQKYYDGYVPPPKPAREPSGYDPYVSMASNRGQRRVMGNPNSAASAGLPTLGKRR